MNIQQEVFERYWSWKLGRLKCPKVRTAAELFGFLEVVGGWHVVGVRVSTNVHILTGNRQTTVIVQGFPRTEAGFWRKKMFKVTRKEAFDVELLRMLVESAVGPVSYVNRAKMKPFYTFRVIPPKNRKNGYIHRSMDIARLVNITEGTLRKYGAKGS